MAVPLAALLKLALEPYVPLDELATVTKLELALVAVRVPTHADIVVGVALNEAVEFAATLPLLVPNAILGVY